MITPSDTHMSLAEDIAPDLTPLLDIIFILLVFFMLTSGDITQSLKMTLPENTQKALPSAKVENSIMLEIGKNSYALAGKKITRFHQLIGLIKQQDLKKNKLIIASDKDVSVERFLQVLTYLQQSGIHNTHILIKNKE